MINKIKLYFQGVITESRKINWPSRQKVINDTLIVIAVVAVATLIFGAIDLGLSKILERFIFWR